MLYFYFFKSSVNFVWKEEHDDVEKKPNLSAPKLINRTQVFIFLNNLILEQKSVEYNFN